MKSIQIVFIICLGLYGAWGEPSHLWAKQKPQKSLGTTKELLTAESGRAKLPKKNKIRVGFHKGHLYVQLQPRWGEGAFQFAQRVMKDWKTKYQDILKYNQNRPLRVGHFVKFPFNVLKGSLQGKVLRGLFTHDTAEEQGWVHRISYSGETLSFVAGVFTKQGISAKKLAQYNKLKHQGRKVVIGETIVIPWEWLRPELDLQPILSVRPPLKLNKSTPRPKYASYQLKTGETIYSTIIRFTDRILPLEVNRLSKKILALNQISDPKKIPPKKQIKIPLAWLSEEYLLEKNTFVAQKASKKSRPKPKKASTQSHAIHIILDAGHGGNDPGAVAGSKKQGDLVYEDEVVYDISLRMKKLMPTPKYRVYLTIKDPNQSKPLKTLYTQDKDEILLVNPHYRLAKSSVGVNLRVYLANHTYKKLVQQKVPKENIIFMSLHADARHQSLRGAMVYYPDSRFRMKVFALRDQIYRRRKEYKYKIQFSPNENQLIAESSKIFGETIINTFEENHILTHQPRPLRSYLYRDGRRTLPAVLRFSKIPTSVLVEVANLTNLKDRREMLQSKYRQKIAESLVKAIENHFTKKINLEVATR